MLFSLVKLFQRVKRLSSLQRHFSIFLKTEFRVAFLFQLCLVNSWRNVWIKITHLNLLLITGKAFPWTWLVEHRLWSSFTIRWIILCKAIHISVYLLLQGQLILNLLWCVYFLSVYNGDVGVSTFFPEYKPMKRNLPMKRKTDNLDA